jgi:hypothetical protein
MSRLPRGSVKIYDICLEIRAKKGNENESLWPHELFKHSFSERSKAAIYGLPNGDILIRSQVGKKLWKRFTYSDSTGTRS